MSATVAPADTVGSRGGEFEVTGAVAPAQRVALVDLLDRLLAGGVVLSGDVTISLAEVELVHISLRVVISSIDTLGEP